MKMNWRSKQGDWNKNEKVKKLVDSESIKSDQIAVEVYIFSDNFIYFLSDVKLTIYQTTIYIYRKARNMKSAASNIYSLILSRKPGKNLLFPAPTINHSG